MVPTALAMHDAIMWRSQKTKLIGLLTVPNDDGLKCDLQQLQNTLAVCGQAGNVLPSTASVRRSSREDV
jgi:hypothetical protein